MVPSAATSASDGQQGVGLHAHQGHTAIGMEIDIVLGTKCERDPRRQDQPYQGQGHGTVSSRAKIWCSLSCRSSRPFPYFIGRTCPRQETKKLLLRNIFKFLLLRADGLYTIPWF